MHTTITLLVYTKNREDAVSKGESILNGLVENGDIDYFNIEGSEIRYHTNKGKKLVNEAWTATAKDFYYYYDLAMNGLKSFSKEELLLGDYEKKDSNGWNSTMILHFAHRLYEQYPAYLYDNDGEQINDKNHLDNALKKWGSEDYKGLDIWLVRADVHT